jgi:hypothetical protein
MFWEEGSELQTCMAGHTNAIQTHDVTLAFFLLLSSLSFFRFFVFSVAGYRYDIPGYAIDDSRLADQWWAIAIAS